MSTENLTPKPSTTEPAGKERGHGTLILALAVVVLIVVAGIAAMVTRHGDDTAAPTTPPASMTAAPTAQPGHSGFSAPTVDDFGRRVDVPNNPAGQPLPQTETPKRSTDPDWLTAAPAGTRERGGWQRVYGAVVPFSTSDGPTRIDSGGLAAGWAHTPQGAALAGAYILYMELARPADSGLRDKLMAMTPAQRAEYDAAAAAGKLPAGVPETVSRWMLASEAYKVVSWADDLCIVRYAHKAEADATGAARWLSSELAMVWDGATWRRRVPPSTLLPQERVPSLAGWSRW